MKRQTWMALLLVVALLLAACSPAASTTTPTPTQTETTTEQPATETTSEGSSAAPSESAKPIDSEADARIGMLRGPTAMGAIAMMRDAEQAGEEGETLPYHYDFTLMGAVDEIAPRLIRGELDISAVPANLASVLYNNTEGGIVVLAVNTLGVLYIVENGEEIQSLEDLRGRTLLASGKGASPEYALRHLLEKHGIDPDEDLTIEWKSEHAEAVAAMAGDTHTVAILPQPFITVAQSKNPAIRVAVDLNAAWEEMEKDADEPSTLITGVVVARRAFVEAQPELIEDFMARYRNSVDFVQKNVDEAAELIGHYEIVPAPIAKRALPQCNIAFVEGEALRTTLGQYLAILHAQNPKAVGGELPADDFYYGLP